MKNKQTDRDTEREAFLLAHPEASSRDVWNAAWEEAKKRSLPGATHGSQCILQQLERGEPTEDGGYRKMYAGTWYYNGEEPDCDCGRIDPTDQLTNTRP